MNWKKIAPHFLALMAFFVLTVGYFSPSIVDKKVLQQPDTEKYEGMINELKQYHQSEGGVSGWLGSMFSGMPAYNVGHYDHEPNYVGYLDQLIRQLDATGGSIVLAALISFYILMCVLGVNVWLAMAGAFAFAFSSYTFILIVAGHVTKGYVVAYMPLTLAGMFLLYHGRKLWGFVLFTIGITLSIYSLHPQITYYLMLFCLFLFVGVAVSMFERKQRADLAKATGLMMLGVVLSVLPNSSSLYTNLMMSKESLRGPSELTAKTTNNETASTGLEIGYAYQWSYGKAETLTLLVPNLYGGGSGGTVGKESELVKALKQQGAQVGNTTQTYTYWGDQPFTSGPVYLGAAVCFLFLLGMMVIKNRLKWYILAGTLFLILLSWGRNLMPFNALMFDFLPLYNKFRAPSMALVIPQLTFPFIAMWGLKTIFEGQVNRHELKRALLTSLSVVGGVCVLLWLMPQLFFNFTSPLDPSYNLPQWYYAALLADRQTLCSDDALRSLLLVLAVALPLLWMWNNKAESNKKWIAAISMIVMIITAADLWSVGKRYLNDSHFKRQHALVDNIKPTVANEAILKDTHPSYRVFNLNNPWNDSHTAYFHKDIGGYSAAKLRRYQELIEHCIQKDLQTLFDTFKEAKSTQEITESFAHTPILNMLNMRYLIYANDQPPVANPMAYGNGWFVKEIEIVPNADAEMAAMQTLKPLDKAVVDERFSHQLNEFTPQFDSTATLTLTHYKPDRLTYRTNSLTNQLAVFSEVYFRSGNNGWQAYIDGQAVPHLRCNWILRGMKIPAGEHTVEFVFEPKTVHQFDKITSISSALLILLLLGTIGQGIRKTVKKRKKQA